MLDLMVQQTIQSAAAVHSHFGRLGILSLLVGLTFCPLVQATDWMTWPSSYTHSTSGQRVDQYALPEEALGPNPSDVVRSGFRHYRSSLQVGQSADNYHITEQWGDPIVPYEHWRFPFRPFGVPYDAWGPPTPYGMFFGAGLGFPGAPWGGWQGQGGHGGHGGHGGQAGWGGPGSGAGGWGGAGPGGGWGGAGPGGAGWGLPAFPLQPNYNNQPWFDGHYPDAPPTNIQPDREFFYKPTR